MTEENNNIAQNLVEAFDLQDQGNNDQVTLKVIAVGGVETINARIGDTIGELKEDNGYDETTKITNASGIPLRDDFVIEGDMTLYVSVPKQNG